MKQISIIVAVAEDMGIGKDNKLLCHIPGDLPRFKKITVGNTVIMGKNTYLSLPNKPLQNRRNIVISDCKSDNFEGCITVFSIDQAIDLCEDHHENFIIGGASVYRQFLPIASRLYLTLIHKKFDADTFFPQINWSEWVEKSREIHDEKKGIDFDYEYIILERKS